MSAAFSPNRDGSRAQPEQPATILAIDDDEILLRSLRRILEAQGHQVLTACAVESAESYLKNADLDVVLLDLFMGGETGISLLERLAKERPETSAIVMTGHASIESAVGCMQRGAFDYLAKPFEDLHRVRTTVEKAIERKRLILRNRHLEEELRFRGGTAALVGQSSRMRALARTIQNLKHNESHVLILGESGTGKELVARALHSASRRVKGPFIPVDCGALPRKHHRK